MKKKAIDAERILQDLCERFDIKMIPTTFVVGEDKKEIFDAICYSENPFPAPFTSFMEMMRGGAVGKLFQDEKIPQTAAIAAVLAACSSVATEVGAQYLHECADLCEQKTAEEEFPIWEHVLTYIEDCAIPGKSGIPGPATYNTKYPTNLDNWNYSDGNIGWKQ